MKHKTISIERVSNGWIVRPFSFNPHMCGMDQGVVAVYTDMKAMQDALPNLVEGPNPPEVIAHEN